MMPTSDEWARAFAKQARADFDAWNLLQSPLDIPEGASPLFRCQKLHFLQMAFEKLAKAHLLKAGSKISDLRQSHAYVAKHIPVIVRQQMILSGEKERVANALRDHCKRIAREVELLSPSVADGGKREDNCEYPWADGEGLYIPVEWAFPNLNLLTEPAARNILKRIRDAIERLTL
ncbi:MAG: hypothetical protein JWO38_5178 [Gemmataceae bacterium]|nr:hypothetical protein [Gemmataceae bacterium]